MTENTNDDLVSEILGKVQLRASVYANPTVCGEWQIDDSPHQGPQFHLISRGSCFLHLPNQAEPRPMRAGDLCVFPRGGWHLLTPDGKARDIGLSIGIPGSGPSTSLVCGSFEFEEGTPSGLLDALPDAIVVPAENVGEGFGALLRLLADEALGERIGGKVVMDKLADALFVMVLRHHLSHLRTGQQGLLAAIADPRLGRALLAVHRAPGDPWTLGDLAERAGMSRTAFAVRFTEVIGVTPIAYLAAYRMQEARRLFHDPRNSVARVAAQLGYDTEAAFRRAFKRITGENPGHLRRNARQMGSQARRRKPPEPEPEAVLPT